MKQIGHEHRLGVGGGGWGSTTTCPKIVSETNCCNGMNLQQNKRAKTCLKTSLNEITLSKY
jgi:hypothetical protein